MPTMVLVDVDGVRLWYPSSFIVIQASDDLLIKYMDAFVHLLDLDLFIFIFVELEMYH